MQEKAVAQQAATRGRQQGNHQHAGQVIALVQPHNRPAHRPQKEGNEVEQERNLELRLLQHGLAPLLEGQRCPGESESVYARTTCHTRTGYPGPSGIPSTNHRMKKASQAIRTTTATGSISATSDPTPEFFW